MNNTNPIRKYRKPNINTYCYVVVHNMVSSLKFFIIISFVIGLIGAWLMSKTDFMQGFLISFLGSFLILFIPKLLWSIVIKYLEVQRIGIDFDEKNIYLSSGLFSRSQVALPLEKMDSALFYQDLLGKILGVGVVNIVSREVTTSTPALNKELGELLVEVISKRGNKNNKN